MFDIIKISAFKDNYIWLLRKGTSAVVVDPGDTRPVLEVLAGEGLGLSAILVTHHHQDHQGGVATLLERFPAIEVFGPAAESITGLTRPLSGGETIDVAALQANFQVLAVPGHTLGHLAYHAGDVLFCGDTLFAGGCGRVFEGTAVQMYESLMSLAALPERTAVYCAHEYTEANLRFALAVEPGNRRLCQRIDEAACIRANGMATVPSTIALEKATNPFLRCDIPEIVASVRAQGYPVGNDIEVFAGLRDWKNSF